MNGEPTEVDPDLLRQAGTGMLSATDQLQAGLAAFEAELAGFGEPWGADDLGSLIGMCYQTIAGIAMECYRVNSEALAMHGEGVKAMAENYDAAERASADGFTNLQRLLG